jgi:O-antigen/teichoic acid export membrane protein
MSNARLISRNFLATLVTQLVSWVLTFIVTMYLPRYAGTDGMGRLAVAGSFIAIFSVLASLGTSSVLIKDIARDHSRAGELLGAALLVRIPLALLLGAIGYGIACLLNYATELRLFILLAAIGIVVGTVNDVLGAVLQGMEKLTRQSLGYYLISSS